MQEALRAVLVQDMARALLLAAAAFALTLATGGYWVRFLRRHRIGKQIRVEGPQSHMVKTGTPTMGGIIILLASQFGIPVSTTHTIIGSIVGVGATNRLSAVRWGLAGRIVWAWVLTIPASAIMAALSFWLLNTVYPL